MCASTPPDAETSATSSSANHSPASSKGPVFVAGATGRTGSRIVRVLLSEGVPVRAGCRDPSSASKKLGSVLVDAGVSKQDVETLISYVSFDVMQPATYEDAIGDSRVVVSALGATESLNPTTFAMVDGFGVKRLMESSAQRSLVKQLVLVSSIGTGNPFKFPAAVLNLFGGVLLWKDYSERAMRKAARGNGKTFFIVRPGALERYNDDHEKTHNTVLEKRGRLGGGGISRLQVARLVAAAILNPEVAENKTVEAIAKDSAPLVDAKSLIAAVKEDTAP